MKSFVIVLLCALAAAQGRSTSVAVARERTLADLGENPWVVHIRLAVSVSGLLNTCAGALIDASWVLTSARCVNNARFLWLRFGAVEVIKPELVLESSAVRPHQEWDQHTGLNDIALIAVNYEIPNTQNIAAISLPALDASVPSTAKFCAYGQNEDRNPGDQLSCTDVEVLAFFNILAATADDLPVSTFDTGAALVSDGVHIGILTEAGDANTALFLRTSAYTHWIQQQTGIQINRADAAPGNVIVVN